MLSAFLWISISLIIIDKRNEIRVAVWATIIVGIRMVDPYANSGFFWLWLSLRWKAYVWSFGYKRSSFQANLNKFFSNLVNWTFNLSSKFYIPWLFIKSNLTWRILTLFYWLSSAILLEILDLLNLNEVID